MARRSERSAAAAAALAAAASASEAAAAAAAEPEPVFCLCRQPDDGIRPMIACEGGCEDWFHATTCVPGLSDDNYEQIDDFICPNCEASTGRKTTWLENGLPSTSGGNSAAFMLDPSLMDQLDPSLLVSAGQPADLNQDVDMTSAYDPSSVFMPLSAGPTAAIAKPSDPPREAAPAGVSPSALVSPKGGRPPAGPDRHLNDQTGSSAAPAASSASSRKPSSSATARLKDSDAAAYHDTDGDVLIMESEPPTPAGRPSIKPAPKRKESGTGSGGASPGVAAKERERLLAKTREQCRESIRTVVVPLLGEEQAPTFARELEELVFTAEDGGSDKGRKKYLDRMRSFRFNVSKPDRKVLRDGIKDGSITAERLSKITTAELANPALQDQMKSAHEEAIRERVMTADMSGPMLSNSHKGPAELTDARAEAQRLEARERALGDEERRRRKREREWGEKAGAERTVAGAATDGGPEEKRRKSSGAFDSEKSGSRSPEQSRQIKGASPTAILAKAAEAAAASRPAPPTHRFSLDAVWAAGEGSAEASTTPPESPHRAGADDALNEFLSEDVFDKPAASGSRPHADEREMSPFDEAGGGEDNGFGFDFFVDDPKITEKADGESTGQPVALKAPKETVHAAGPLAYSEAAQLGCEKDLLALETVWRGEISNPDAPHPGPVSARQVAGPAIPASFWPILLPSNTLGFVGRVRTPNSRKFLHQAQLSPSKDVIVVLLEGDGAQGEKALQGHMAFLLERERDALIQPYGASDTLPAGAARDMYMLVLRQSDELPEFLDGLPSSKIPEAVKDRTRDYMLGILIRPKHGHAAVVSKPAAPQVAPGLTTSATNLHSPAPAAAVNGHSPMPPTIGGGTPYQVPYEYKPPGAAPVAASPLPPPLNGTPLARAPSAAYSPPSAPAPAPAPQAPVIPDASSIASLLATLQGTLPPVLAPPAGPSAPGFSPPPPSMGSHSPYATAIPPTSYGADRPPTGPAAGWTGSMHAPPVPAAYGQSPNAYAPGPYNNDGGGGAYPPPGPHQPVGGGWQNGYHHQQGPPPRTAPSYGAPQPSHGGGWGRDEPPHAASAFRGGPAGRGGAFPPRGGGRFGQGSPPGDTRGGGPPPVAPPAPGQSRDSGWGGRGRGRGGY